MELQDLEDFALLAVVHERNKALVRLGGNELVGVGAFFEEDLDDGVKRWLHYTLEGVEHVRESDQSNAGDGRAQGVGKL